MRRRGRQYFLRNMTRLDGDPATACKVRFFLNPEFAMLAGVLPHELVAAFSIPSMPFVRKTRRNCRRDRMFRAAAGREEDGRARRFGFRLARRGRNRSCSANTSYASRSGKSLGLARSRFRIGDIVHYPRETTSKTACQLGRRRPYADDRESPPKTLFFGGWLTDTLDGLSVPPSSQ